MISLQVTRREQTSTRRAQQSHDDNILLEWLQRGGPDVADLPWVYRDPAAAEAMLQAAANGGLPQRRVERLALLHLLVRLHREAHLRSGMLSIAEYAFTASMHREA